MWTLYNYLDNHHVRWLEENERRTFGIGENIVGIIRPLTGRCNSGASSTSSGSLPDNGGGGTGLLRFGEGSGDVGGGANAGWRREISWAGVTVICGDSVTLS